MAAYLLIIGYAQVCVVWEDENHQSTLSSRTRPEVVALADGILEDIARQRAREQLGGRLPFPWELATVLAEAHRPRGTHLLFKHLC